MSQAIPLESLAKPEKIVHDRPPMLAIGVMIWLGSELMFFSGLFAALFTIRAHLAAWPPRGTHLDTVQAGIFTVVLVGSSFTMQWAVWLIEHRRREEARRWVIVTMIQRRASSRRRCSTSHTAHCMVNEDATSTMVKIPAWVVSRCVPTGGQAARCARMVKRAAKSPEKNINSLPSQIITPMASIGGRSWTIFSGFARLSRGIA